MHAKMMLIGCNTPSLHVLQPSRRTGSPDQVCPWCMYQGVCYYMQSDKKAQNKMRDIRVAKLVLNICVGESGDRLQKAAKVSNSAFAFGYHEGSDGS